MNAAIERGGFIALQVGLFVGVAYWIKLQFDKAKQGVKDVTAPAAEVVGQALAEVTMAANGSHDIEYPQAGFVLNAKYISADGVIDVNWRKVMMPLHEEHPRLFSVISDRDGRVRREYQHLIGQLVSPETVGGW